MDELNTVASQVDFTKITSAITGAVSVGDVVGVIAIGLGAGVGFFFVFWGARKLWVMFKSFISGRGGKI